MRIVHLLLTRRFAGSERYALELAQAQAQAGHDVSMVLRSAGRGDHPDSIARRVSPAVRVVVVPDWLAWWHARRVVAKMDADVAHAHLSGGCRALRGLRGRVLRVATLHIHYKPQQHAHLDGLVAIAPWQLASIPEPLRARTAQIDNWTLPVEPGPDARAQIRAAHGIGSDELLFGALGRIEDTKGLDVLVDAFARAAMPRTRLAVVGHGRAFQAIRKRADDTVVMPGFVERPQDWFSAFDCFVSAARTEPFGLVFLEAMQSGLPIIATASDGARHLHRLIGTPLVPIGDAAALAQALQSIGSRLVPGQRRAYDIEPLRLPAKLAEIDAFYRATAKALGKTLPGTH